MSFWVQCEIDDQNRMQSNDCDLLYWQSPLKFSITNSNHVSMWERINVITSSTPSRWRDNFNLAYRRTPSDTAVKHFLIGQFAWNYHFSTFQMHFSTFQMHFSGTSQSESLNSWDILKMFDNNLSPLNMIKIRRSFLLFPTLILSKLSPDTIVVVVAATNHSKPMIMSHPLSCIVWGHHQTLTRDRNGGKGIVLRQKRHTRIQTRTQTHTEYTS